MERGIDQCDHFRAGGISQRLERRTSDADIIPAVGRREQGILHLMIELFRDLLKLTHIHEQPEYTGGFCTHIHMLIVLEHIKKYDHKLGVFGFIQEADSTRPYMRIGVGEEGARQVIKGDEGIGFSQRFKLLEESQLAAWVNARPYIQKTLQFHRSNIRKFLQIMAREFSVLRKQGV